MSVPRWLVPWLVVVGIIAGVIDPRSDDRVIGLTPFGELLDRLAAAVGEGGR